MQLIGKLMRSADVEPARVAVAERQLGRARDSLALHSAERWRAELIADDDATTRFASAHAGADLQQLRALVRNARKDAAAAARAAQRPRLPRAVPVHPRARKRCLRTSPPRPTRERVRIGLVSVSDRASTGVYEDKGIPALREWLARALLNPIDWEPRLIPDDEATIAATLRELVDDRALRPRAHHRRHRARRRATSRPRRRSPSRPRRCPASASRCGASALAFVPTAILSRQVAVVRGRALIVNLPGQPKAIAETLEGMRGATPPLPGIFAAVPYCIDLIGGPYLETDDAVCAAFRPKSAPVRTAARRRYLTRRFNRSASKFSVVCASPGTQSSLGSSRVRDESFSIACQSSAIWCSCARGVVDQPLHRLRHRVVALRQAVGRKAHLRRRCLARRIGLGLDDARRIADRGRTRRHRLDAPPRPSRRARRHRR